MRSPEPNESPLVDQRALRWLFVLVCLFILYGTFIPFRFSDDPGFLESQWRGFLKPPFHNGRKTFSFLDVIANFLLFVPFGSLLVGSGLRRLCSASFLRTLFWAGLCGFLFSLGIELGQVYSPGRTPSLLDAVINGVGAAVGGSFGFVLFRGLRGDLGKAMLVVLCARPAWVLLALLLIVPVADAFYPFHLTLDVSTGWSNLKRTEWLPFRAGMHRHWLDLIVEKVFVYAAMAYLVVLGFRQSQRIAGAAIPLGFCFAVGFFVEAGKLLFVGRVPNLENFLLAAAGALLGVLLVTPLSQTNICRRHGYKILLGLALALMIHAELSPFDWIASTEELTQRWQRIEWLPMAAYYGAEPQAALFDLGKKLFIAGPLGLLLGAHRQAKGNCPARLQALLCGLLMGLILEACQLGLRSRTPSITDVLLFGAAACSGAALFAYWIGLRKSQSPSSNGQPSLTANAIPG